MCSRYITVHVITEYFESIFKLEQLECLRSEDIPPPPHDYPYYWVILDLKSKEDKVKVTNLKNFPKFKIFEFWKKNLTGDTPPEVVW